MVFDDQFVQTMIDLNEPQRLQHAYARAMMSGLLYADRPASILLVGLGGGAFVRFLNHYFPDTRLDAVELDPVVVQVARDYFGTKEGPRTRIFTADGRDFLQRSSERYDLILLDAHLHPRETTDSTGHPLGMQTEAFYRSLHERLNPGGVVLFNLLEGDDARAYVPRIRSAFAGTEVLALLATRNLVVVARPHGPLPAEEVLAKRARDLDRRGDYGFTFEQLLKLRQRPS